MELNEINILDKELYGIENTGKVYFIEPFENIKLPFYIYVPNELNENSSILLNTCTSENGTKKALKENKSEYGTFDDALSAIIDVALVEREFDPVPKKITHKYNHVMLVPLIPRCLGLNSQFLGYDNYHNDFTAAIKGYHDGWSKFTPSDLERFKNLDEQIVAMIEYTHEFIKKKFEYVLDEKVIITGYSAAGEFATHFTALHPKLIKMVIAGGTNPIFPSTTYNGYPLDYPVGFNDIKEDNLELFKEIPQFYYVGEDDVEDPSVPECEYEIEGYRDDGKPIFKKNYMDNLIPVMENGMYKFKRDKNGNYINRDGGYYSLEQIHIINDHINCFPNQRFDILKDIYDSLNVNIILKKYKGNHIIKDDRLEDDIFAFYENYINDKIHSK